ncbi:hypothetical protein DNU06_12685 [Putridiphycobacter roseus]|uniref:RNA polymerase subunit sigma-70 n=1 Tax=Putridiphycobacter roseus TaxID=2219161 RepID=A0A2W1N0E8_9FLAO|nr:RNA polymerase sigma factor [Putridiphycobacter roseus]PZE16401.1 hypothetical protein DNU06_12685 [Putridiphycobacter roseus]
MRLFKKDYKTYSDEELMLLFQKGDKKALEQIYHRYANHLVNFFYNKLWQDREKAEDATQDIFSKLIQKPALFDASKNFKTWVFSVAFNRCKNEYKKQEVRKNVREEPEDNYQPKDSNIIADELYDQQDFGQKLKQKLAEMNEKHSQVFKLRHEDGLSMKEIAEVLTLNEGTVKSRLHYATKYLAEQLAVYQKLIAK